MATTHCNPHSSIHPRHQNMESKRLDMGTRSHNCRISKFKHDGITTNIQPSSYRNLRVHVNNLHAKNIQRRMGRHTRSMVLLSSNPRPIQTNRISPNRNNLYPTTRILQKTSILPIRSLPTMFLPGDNNNNGTLKNGL